MRNPARVLNDSRTGEAAYCAHCLDESYKAARARWAMDYTGLESVHWGLYAFACNLAAIERWRLPTDRDYPQEFSQLAILELKYPREFSMLAPEKRDAAKDRKANQTKRADFLGIPYKTYMNYWKTRYQAIYQKLEDDIDDTFRQIWRNQLDKGE